MSHSVLLYFSNENISTTEILLNDDSKVSDRYFNPYEIHTKLLCHRDIVIYNKKYIFGLCF